MKQGLSSLSRYVSSMHVKGRKSDVFLLSTPRSGSTWLMEAIAAERGMRPCNEPLNLRKPEVVRRLRISEWDVLEREGSLPLIEMYFRRLMAGGLGYTFKTPRPHQRGYHLLSNRVLFKVLFGCETRVSWLKSTFNCKVICLIRHPIPVSLSREHLPRLPSLMNSSHVERLTPSQRAAADRIYRTGSQLELAQLDWCLQNGPLTESIDQTDLFVTYEQLVLQPDVVVNRIIEVLDLDDGERVRSSFQRLSGSVSKSSESSVKLLMERQSNAFSLISKWRRSVSELEEHELMSVVRQLGINIYSAGRFLPEKQYWIGHDYPEEITPVQWRTSCQP